MFFSTPTTTLTLILSLGVPFSEKLWTCHYSSSIPCWCIDDYMFWRSNQLWLQTHHYFSLNVAGETKQRYKTTSGAKLIYLIDINRQQIASGNSTFLRVRFWSKLHKTWQLKVELWCKSLPFSGRCVLIRKVQVDWQWKRIENFRRAEATLLTRYLFTPWFLPECNRHYVSSPDTHAPSLTTLSILPGFY